MQLEGEIKNVIFRSEETGYTVLDLKVEDSLFTVVGTMPPVSAGQRLKAEGDFRTRSLYGRQFTAEKVYVGAPSRVDGMIKFLGSGLIKGLGPVTAAAIVERYGTESLEMMKYPIEIAKVKGVSLRKATEFCLAYSGLQKLQAAVMFLQGLGLTVNLSLKIYRAYGDATEQKVRSNPYVLVDDIEGVGFATADRIAEELGIARDSDFRICAAVNFVLAEASAKFGHNYLPENELLSGAIDLLKLDIEETERRVRDNIEDMIMLGELVRYDTGECVALLTRRSYNTEVGIARRLVRLAAEAADFRVDVAAEVARFEREAGFELHPTQVDAVRAAVENGVQIVTGGPGTGKTTIVKCILRMFDNLGQKVALCAPTGRAAKRMSVATGAAAKTIHRLLELDWREDGGHFSYNENRPLPLDAVIVDEVSMVDEFVFYALLKALPRGCRLVLVGDKDQLASVGAGNVLSDLIRCGHFPVVELTQIYRQSEDSKIVPNAHKINRGEMPDLDNKSRDFFFEEKEDGDSIARTATDLVTRRLPEYLGVAPLDIQLLCPMKRGSAGTINLNRVLQNALNPPSRDKREARQGENLFREGDKVMQTKNDYNREWKQETDGRVETGTGVFNGDIGVIESINPHIMQFTVRFDDDKVAVYEYSDIEELTLAYAVTIHKSQGSEFDTVVIALDANYMLQTRNLLYTAVTRAKKMVVLVGARKTVARMIRNNETARRYSLLINLIDDEISGRVFP